MIKIRNLDQAILTLEASGTISASLHRACVAVPFDGFIQNIVAKVGAAGSGAGPSIFDLNKNGTTVFGAATKITITATTPVVTYSAQTTDPTPVSAGDLLSLDADSLSTDPVNLSVLVTISRFNPGAGTNVSDHASLI